VSAYLGGGLFLGAGGGLLGRGLGRGGDDVGGGHVGDADGSEQGEQKRSGRRTATRNAREYGHPARTTHLYDGHDLGGMTSRARRVREYNRSVADLCVKFPHFPTHFTLRTRRSTPNLIVTCRAVFDSRKFEKWSKSVDAEANDERCRERPFH
jgi:hypothetical protein